jgi:hypothetical protein
MRPMPLRQTVRRHGELHGPTRTTLIFPLVGVTGWSDERKPDEVELAGVDHVLVKPIDLKPCESSFPSGGVSSAPA